MPLVQHMIDGHGPVLDLGNVAVAESHLCIQLQQHVFPLPPVVAMLSDSLPCRYWLLGQRPKVLLQAVLPHVPYRSESLRAGKVVGETKSLDVHLWKGQHRLWLLLHGRHAKDDGAVNQPDHLLKDAEGIVGASLLDVQVGPGLIQHCPASLSDARMSPLCLDLKLPNPRCEMAMMPLHPFCSTVAEDAELLLAIAAHEAIEVEGAQSLVYIGLIAAVCLIMLRSIVPVASTL